MIDFYFSPTPNGWKVAIMLQETGLAHRTHLVDLPSGDQLKPDYLAINPNGKIPAIVDNDAGGQARSVFESGSILLYLADKTGSFVPRHADGRHDAITWLFWQAANFGPMAGQLSHFVNYAPPDQHYALQRYSREYERCLAVLETRLASKPFVLDDYSIVDMMIFPWAFIAKKLGSDLTKFPAVERWRGRIKERPAVIEAINLFKGEQFTGKTNAENNSVLFNQGAGHLAQGSR